MSGTAMTRNATSATTSQPIRVHGIRQAFYALFGGRQINSIVRGI